MNKKSEIESKGASSKNTKEGRDSSANGRGRPRNSKSGDNQGGES